MCVFTRIPLCLKTPHTNLKKNCLYNLTYSKEVSFCTTLKGTIIGNETTDVIDYIHTIEKED